MMTHDKARDGMTLVEALVAASATVVLIGMLAQLYATLGNARTSSVRGMVFNARVHAVAALLRNDLEGVTVPTRPPLDLSHGTGYFELIEGPAEDAFVGGTPVATGNVIRAGDADDVLLFTAFATSGAFRSSFSESPYALESRAAEIAWFCCPTPGSDSPSTYTLYRKQLLILPETPSPGKFGDAGIDSRWSQAYERGGPISMRLEPDSANPQNPSLVSNSLQDLTRRECRFLHDPDNFPHKFVSHAAAPTADGLIFGADSGRLGEDVILTDVLAFDVRVFDPTAPVVASPPRAGPDGIPRPFNVNVPGDPGFSPSATVVGTGAYVNLGYGLIFESAGQSLNNPFKGTDVFHFAAGCEPQSGLSEGAGGRRVFDTWSSHYISSELDPFTNSPKARVPPYPHPLRGIEVRIRCYEPSSRQVRQVTVRHSFVPH